MKLRQKKAQAAIEYAIIFLVVTMAAFAIFGNLARGGRLRQIFESYVGGQ